MYSAEIFDKLIQLFFPVLPYIEDIIFLAISYQWLEMVAVYIFVFEIAHEDVGIRRCHSSPHGGTTFW